MNKFESNYSYIMSNCLKCGDKIVGRNGRIRQITNVTISANLKEGLPVVTGKKIFPKSSFIETEWLLKGLTNTKWLNERGVNIWNMWANEQGELGPVYGKQLIDFNGVNQLELLKKEFINNKHSRRLLCSMWNPLDLNEMALPPCHYSFQFLVYKTEVDIIVTMRSLDLFIGLPYDIIMYSIILLAFCNEHNLTARSVYINAASAHVYEEHVSSAAIYNGRKKFKLPTVKLNTTLSNFDSSNIELIGYNYHDRLKVNVIK